MSPESPAFELPVRVYYEDTDAGGVVYHARYLHFMERARTEWLRALGFDQQRLRDEQGVLFAVRRMQIDFVRPARFDDALVVSAEITAHGRASIDFVQQVLRAGDDASCCRAEVNIACVDTRRLRPSRIPAEILSVLRGAGSAAAEAETDDGI